MLWGARGGLGWGEKDGKDQRDEKDFTDWKDG